MALLAINVTLIFFYYYYYTNNNNKQIVSLLHFQNILYLSVYGVKMKSEVYGRVEWL